MTTPTPTETTQPKKSRTMLYAAIVIIVIIIAGAIAYFAFFSGGSTFTPNVVVHLSGNATNGWNNTIPGPTITIKVNDKVQVVLTSADSVTHDFYIDYAGSGTVGSQAHSATFSSPTTPIYYNFTATQSGTFKYYCEFHQAQMYGSIVINP